MEQRPPTAAREHEEAQRAHLVAHERLHHRRELVALERARVVRVEPRGYYDIVYRARNGGALTTRT